VFLFLQFSVFIVLFNEVVKNEEKLYALKWATIITGGTAVLFLLFKNTLFNFSGGNDGIYVEQMGAGFVRALKEDRQAMFTTDALRSLVFVILSAALIWMYIKRRQVKICLCWAFPCLSSQILLQ
jgi:hypothetical protein